MLSKKDIFSLISTGDYVEAFAELNKYFLKRNDSLNALEKELINQPMYFNPALFNTRLKLFINSEYPEDLPEPNKEKHHADDYELLCEIDFKIQTENFQSIYQHKKIAAFLLHGETDEQGNDSKWLYNQILHKEGLVRDKSVIIDFSSPLGGSFERLLEEFYLKFEIEAVDKQIDKIDLLRDEIEERLKADHLVCIIKSPGSILNEESELCKLFDNFLCFMNKHVVRRKHKHSFVILFVEDKLVDYKCKEDKYFFWFDAELQSEYSINAAECSDLKIIDLAPIERIKKEDIIKWIQLSLRLRPDVSEKIINSKAKYILQAGNTPYKAIENICKDLDIIIQAKWIS
jgi:hypothetical protein